MRGVGLFALSVLVAAAPMGSARAAGILLNDGFSHTVSDGLYASDWVHVRNVGCGTLESLNAACAQPGAATDLLLASGGSAWSLTVDDSSTATLDGGTLAQGVSVRGTSIATLTGGSVGGGISALGSSSLVIHGVAVGQGVYIDDDALVNMSGGSVGADFMVFGASTGVISGGIIAGELNGRSMSAVTVTGGSQQSGWRAGESSTLTIVGSGFTVNGVAVPYGPLVATTGMLAGTLDSGESVAGAAFSQGGTTWDTGRIVLAPSAAPPVASEDVVVAWGGGYLIDDWSYAHDALFVRDVGCGTPAQPQAACGAPGAATTLELAAGGAAGAVAVHDTSTFALTGGLVGTSVEVWDKASIDVSDGLIPGGLLAHDDATLTIGGATLRGGLIADGNARVEMSGGVVRFFTKVEGRASLVMSEGFLGRGLQTKGASTVTVSGGTVAETLDVGGMSAVTLTGGTISSGVRLLSGGSATLMIVGSGFSVDGVAVGYGPLAGASGQLTGTLDSGDTIDHAFGGFSASAPGRIVLAAASSPLPAVADVLLNDGGSHLASDWSGSRSTLYVRNVGCGSVEDPTASCTSPGAASDLEIATGGAVGAVAAYDSALVTLSGGLTGVDVDAWDAAAITITSGIVGGSANAHDSSTITLVDGTLQRLTADDQASIAIGGGRVTARLSTDGSAVAVVTSGEIDEIDAYGSSRVEISGGTVPSGAYAYDTASILFTGGTVEDYVEMYDASTLAIEGGFFDDDVVAYDAASITVDGGTLNYDLGGSGDSTITLRGVTQGVRFSLFVNDTSALTIHGSGFAVDGGAVDFGSLAATSGMLTATFESGEALDSHFFRATTATITLVPVPEPAFALLQAVALLCLGGLARNRRGYRGGKPVESERQPSAETA